MMDMIDTLVTLMPLIMTAIMSVIHNVIIVMQNLQAAMLDHG